MSGEAGSAAYEHRSAHSAEALWGVLSNFTELSWLPGPDRVEAATIDGRTARLLHITGLDEPIIEALIGCDNDARMLRYEVKPNPFVPVANYQAVVSVEAAGDGSLVSFRSTFEEIDTPVEEARAMIEGSYQMMVAALDAAL